MNQQQFKKASELQSAISTLKKYKEYIDMANGDPESKIEIITNENIYPLVLEPELKTPVFESMLHQLTVRIDEKEREFSDL